MGCCESIVNVKIEERCKASDKMRLDEFFASVVDVFFGTESQVVEDQDLAGLHLGDFLDGVWAYDIFYEFDLLGAVLSEEVCMGFERGEVVFSRSALVGAESNACLIQFGEGLGYGLDAGIIEDEVGRRI